MKKLAIVLAVVGVYAVLITVSHEIRRANDPVQQAETLYLSTHGTPRSPHWSKVRAAYLAEHPECAVCGTTKAVEIHHRVPYHIDPSRELDPKNLIGLCRVHHQWWGHLGRWDSWNETVEEDAAIWREKIRNRP